MRGKPPRRSRRRKVGSILLLVLVVVSVLTVGTATYLRLMQNEHRAVRQLGRMRQSTALAESGVTYLQAFLAQSPQEIFLQGDLHNNPQWMQAVLVTENRMDFDRGRFSVVAPALNATGDYAGLRFGVEDEAAKLNLNALLAGSDESSDDSSSGSSLGSPADRLSFLPGMTPEIADAILDWLDEDDTPRMFGAESETYQALDPPYWPRNGPIHDLDELLLVRGVTPELLYGLDQNRNMQVDADELPRGVLAEMDVTGGALSRGWSAFLTTHSVERFQTSQGARPTNLNLGNMQDLYNALSQSLGEEQAKFIVLYRQFGGANDEADSPDAETEGRGDDDRGQPTPASAV
ncbi:MAG: hypothetical protein AAF961_02675, partial [Planctomycetota bacterium]